MYHLLKKGPVHVFGEAGYSVVGCDGVVAVAQMSGPVQSHERCMTHACGDRWLRYVWGGILLVAASAERGNCTKVGRCDRNQDLGMETLLCQALAMVLNAL